MNENFHPRFMHNKIQVFGLPRSGTNFLEWSLMNNFKDFKYFIGNTYTDVEGLFFYKQEILTSIKHTYPNLNNCEFALVIFNDYEDWYQSMFRLGWHRGEEKETYDKYLKTAESLDPERTIILNHKWCTQNYKECMELISKKTNVELNEEIKIPEFRFHMSNNPTEEKYQLK